MAGFIDPLNRNDAPPEILFDPYDIHDNRIFAALSYWWILFFIPLVVNPRSYYGRFHANQGLVLLIASVICSVAIIIPFFGIFITLIGSVTCFIFQILGTINAWQGKGKRLPLIGGIELIH